MRVPADELLTGDLIVHPPRGTDPWTVESVEDWEDGTGDVTVYASIGLRHEEWYVNGQTNVDIIRPGSFESFDEGVMSDLDTGLVGGGDDPESDDVVEGPTPEPSSEDGYDDEDQDGENEPPPVPPTELDAETFRLLVREIVHAKPDDDDLDILAMLEKDHMIRADEIGCIGCG